MEYIEKLDEMFGINDWEASWLDEDADTSEYLMALRLQLIHGWNWRKAQNSKSHDYGLGTKLNRTVHLIDELAEAIESVHNRINQLISFAERSISPEQMEELLNILYWESDMDFEDMTFYATVKHRVKHAVKPKTEEYECYNCTALYIKTLQTTSDIPAVPICPSCKESIRKTQGYVYLVQSPTQYYKIGRTRNPNNRIKTFGVKLPFEVEYACIIHTLDMFSLESELHQKFANKRGDGEWFALDENDVNYIKRLVDTHDFASYVLYSMEAEGES